MRCNDEFRRIVNKRGEGEPTIPASDDHQNGDWIDTDLYEGESYEDVLTGKLYYRNSTGIEETFDPAVGVDQRFGIGDTTINTDREVDTSTGSFTFNGTGGAPLLAPVAGDGVYGVTDTGAGVFGVAQVNGNAIKGVANTGICGYFTSGGTAILGISNAGAGLFVESQTNVGSLITGRLLINIFGDGATLDTSAVLHLSSTTSGFIPPRMTTVQRNAIASPANGLYVYDTTTLSAWIFDGTNWNEQ